MHKASAGAKGLHVVENIETTLEPTMEPSIEPTLEPSVQPTLDFTEEPTVEPTMDFSLEPTLEPSLPPSVEPSLDPTLEPTSEPTVEPTVEPTGDFDAPTISPTIVDQSVVVICKQTISVSTILYQLSYLTSNAAFEATVNLINSLLPTSTKVVSVVAGESVDLRRVIRVNIRAVKQLESPTSIVTYDIFIPSTASMGYANGENAYQNISSTLESAINDGAFDQVLHENAQTYNATALNSSVISLGFTSTYVTGDPGTNPLDDSSSSDDGLTDGELAGVIIGSVAGFTILTTCCVYFCLSRSSKRSGYDHQPLTSANDVDNPVKGSVEKPDVETDPMLPGNKKPKTSLSKSNKKLSSSTVSAVDRMYTQSGTEMV